MTMNVSNCSLTTISPNYLLMFSMTCLVILGCFLTGSCEEPLIFQDISSSAECRRLQFKQPMVNRTLKCHVIKRVLVESESGCEANCFADDDCMSINLGPKTEDKEDKRYVCEISNSDHDMHPNDMWNMSGFVYKSVWNYCSSSPCPGNQKCQTGFTSKGYRCIETSSEEDVDHTEICWKKINNGPVCLGAKDDSYGRFIIKESGLINTFKLVHLSGSLECCSSCERSFWGCLSDNVAVQLKNIHTIITFENGTVISLADFVRGRSHCGGQYYKYVLEGFDANSAELVFKQLSPKLLVSAGQEFQIWYGEDWKNCWERDNRGETCADVYAWYT